MFLLIKFTLLYAVVLMLVALGGMFSERSGVINIALEGIMAIGGLAGVFVLALCGDSLPSGVLVAVSILASAVAGILYSLLLGFSAITLKEDERNGGTALTPRQRETVRLPQSFPTATRHLSIKSDRSRSTFS